MRFLIILLAMMISQAGLAASNEPNAVYQLPNDWLVESDDDYSFYTDYVAPEPRRGLVFHSYSYDDYDELGKPLYFADEANTQCTSADGWVNGPIYERKFPKRELWLIYAHPEFVILSKTVTKRPDDDCEGESEYEMEITRGMLIGQMVTYTANLAGMSRMRTARADDKLSSLTFGLLPHGDLQEIRTRYAGRSTGRNTSPQGWKSECFYTGNSLDRATSCYLTHPRKFAGLLVDYHSEHTASWSGGRKTIFLNPNAWIDGRLFEWDREITLAQQPKVKPAP